MHVLQPFYFGRTRTPGHLILGVWPNFMAYNTPVSPLTEALFTVDCICFMEDWRDSEWDCYWCALQNAYEAMAQHRSIHRVLYYIVVCESWNILHHRGTDYRVCQHSISKQASRQAAFCWEANLWDARKFVTTGYALLALLVHLSLHVFLPCIW